MVDATYRVFYAPNNSGTDGQNSYFGGELRSIVNDLFRGMTLSRNPELWQSLPAEKQHKLENTPEFVVIEEELKVLALPENTDSTAGNRRKTLNAQKRKLVSEELHKWQKLQPSNIPFSADGNDLIGYQRTQFHRTRCLMPERDRLASSLFLVAPIRSDEGRAVLRDMIALCQQETEVAFCPGLEPEKCSCPMAKLARFVASLELLCILYVQRTRLTRVFPESQPAAKRWRHIYGCYKKKLVISSGFAELCFQCGEWILSEEKWNNHCQDHLQTPETLPVQCNLFVYGGALASPGYCPFCLGDTALPATTRLYQFLDRAKWKMHVDEHITTLDGSRWVQCSHPRPRCVGSFESVQDLKFHLQDVHCIEPTKRSKRRRSHDELETKPDHIKRSRRITLHNTETKINVKTRPGLKHEFVDETTKIVDRQRGGMFTISSIDSENSSSMMIDWDTEKSISATETPASSVYSDVLDKIDPRILND